MSEDLRSRDRERDLVLSPNTYAFILDSTKGQISTYVGPQKTSLSTTDQPVVFSEKTKKFERCNLDDAIQLQPTAPAGWYLVLKNPAADKNNHPRNGATLPTPDLDVGRKINIAGPASFALWPGQMVKVLKGHNLKSNQYLVVRVYDEQAARANWKNAVIKPQVAATKVNIDDIASDPPATPVPPTQEPPPDLVMGKLFIIKGTEVSFYIPPTGMEVVPDNDAPGKTLVREAVTLERLEYCLLLDQNGNKRYVQGPAVVFPEPTEEFVSKNVSKKETEKVNIRKFKAIELNENSGIYVKVIADYKDEDGTCHKVGDELFITGKEQMIYFPREEHAIIKYGTQEIHYGIAIPAGEARYVLNRNTGAIRLVKGESVFLPDPRSEVIVHRILDPKMCEMMYPGNQEALQHNLALIQHATGATEETLDNNAAMYNGVDVTLQGTVRTAASMVSAGYVLPDAQGVKNIALKGVASRGFSGDAFERNNKYTKPRSITLNTKYEGAVAMDIWTGYAVKLVKKNGDHRIVRGPCTAMLEYDESPQVISLSRGKPKSDANRLKTVYLRVSANKVSDIITVETKDLCHMHVEVSYRLNFDGNPSLWFDVEDYVKFLTDHMRSKIRNAVMNVGVETFYASSTDIIRDTVLGKSVEGTRPGAKFKENGMNIYDVEVLSVKMVDAEVEKALVGAQRDVIGQTLLLAQNRRALEQARELEAIKQERMALEQTTQKRAWDIKLADLRTKSEFDLAVVSEGSKATMAKANAESQYQEVLNAIEAAKLEAFKKDKETKLELEQKLLDQKIEEMRAQAAVLKEKACAITPEFIAALQAFGDKALIEKVSQAMGPLAILGGEDVVTVIRKLLAGTDLEKYLQPKKQ